MLLASRFIGMTVQRVGQYYVMVFFVVVVFLVLNDSHSRREKWKRHFQMPKKGHCKTPLVELRVWLCWLVYRLVNLEEFRRIFCLQMREVDCKKKKLNKWVRPFDFRVVADWTGFVIFCDYTWGEWAFTTPWASIQSRVPFISFSPTQSFVVKKKKKKAEMWRKLSFEVGGVAALIYLFCQMGLCHLKTTEWTNNGWIIYFENLI